MKIEISLNNNKYEIDVSKSYDISIPLDFENKQINFYDDKALSVDYLKFSNKEYNLEKKAACNVPIINLNIHCSGTHTETANHILKNGLKINQIKIPHFIPCQLITVKPVENTNESYHVDCDSSDKKITKSDIKNLIDLDTAFNQGLIIRTLPNSKLKLSYDYNKNNHPFLTNDAIIFIKKMGFKHLIIDTPSIDKFDDKGKLGNHHIYFKNKNGLPNLNTLTEFAYIPNRVVNGKYFLSLNFPNFYLDTAPSRPILFPIKIK